MFHVARGGIFHLFRALALTDKDNVLVPDYHSGNETAAIRAAGAKVTLYRIRRNFEPDLDELSALVRKLKPRLIYTIHYLGWPQPLQQLEALRLENRSLLIEDCALAFLSTIGQRPLGTFGDYSVFCLYKTVPVPNGGMLVKNRNLLSTLCHLNLDPCPAMAVAGRSAELALEAFRSRFDTAGKALFVLKQSIGRGMRSAGVEHWPVGSVSWDTNLVNLAMSRFSDRVLAGLDFNAIRQKRRQNFMLLKQLTEKHVRIPRCDLPEGVCPLFFPILVREKHAVAEALRQKGIEAVEFWNARRPDQAIGPDAAFLRAHVLELPIHQDVSQKQIEYIADQVIRLNPVPPVC